MQVAAEAFLTKDNEKPLDDEDDKIQRFALQNDKGFASFALFSAAGNADFPAQW